MSSFCSENIAFPCVWHGSLIVFRGHEGTVSLVRGIYGELGLSSGQVSAGRISAQGSYETYKLSSEVPDLGTLRELFRRLEGLPGVRMLI